MSPRPFFKSMFLIGLLLLPGGIIAQDSTCPTIVSDALVAVDSLCKETGRNQACYGNLTLTAEAQAGADNLTFDTPGDIANVADIQSLALSPLDEAAGDWGISLMKIQANLPDTMPGQNVTMLLFGDVEIENAVGESSDDYTLMQAFYFRSGVGDAPCEEAPESGILIQTPKGAGEIELVVNEVNITLGSTVFLQAVPGDVLYVNLLDGQAKVTAFDETKTVTVGMVVSVPIDENLRASGPPNEPYAAGAIETLSSMVALLPEALTPTEPESTPEIEPVTDESTACTVTAGGNVNLRSGPGTVYTRAGGLAANESANPTGQALGADGVTWWMLENGNWVRSDVVNAAGSCESLPVVTDLPPTPIPVPVAPSLGDNFSSYTVVLPASSPWLDSGIALEIGQVFAVEASGIARGCSGDTPNCDPIGPKGFPGGGLQVFPLPSAPNMSLVGRIGGGNPFRIGAKGVFTAATSGTLQFVVNDDPLADNLGAFTIIIQVAGG